MLTPLFIFSLVAALQRFRNSPRSPTMDADELPTVPVMASINSFGYGAILILTMGKIMEGFDSKPRAIYLL